MRTPITLVQLRDDILACRRCPRLARHHDRLARDLGPGHWKPVPGVGPAHARLWVVGLAPGARGAGVTGVPFTRDRSGLFFRAALARAGVDPERHAWISNAARCVPPENRPTPAELRRCRGYLAAEWELLRQVRAVLCLGEVAWRAVLDVAGAPPIPFAHGASTTAADRTLLASYHVSPLNVNTGRLTPELFDAVVARAVAASSPSLDP